jgi:hypothetical protein
MAGIGKNQFTFHSAEQFPSDALFQFANCWLIEGCEIKHCSAALVMLPVFTMATKYLS